MSLAESAADLVSDHSIIGLGSGRTASDFIRALGQRVAQGLSVQGVPTSTFTASLARQVGIPLIGIDQIDHLDAAFDGADAVDPRLDLIKGLGGALLREKVVASMASRFIILISEKKLTPQLGTGYCRILPIEVVPFALPLVHRRIARLGFSSTNRSNPDGTPFVTDNGNAILDCDISAGLADPRSLDRTLRLIPGVVETGLFLGMAHLILVEQSSGSIARLQRTDHDPTSP